MEKFAESNVRLYTDFHCTFNFHIITKHLIDDVKMHGSLVGHTMYSFESLFGYLKPTIHGTSSLGEQYLKSKFVEDISLKASPTNCILNIN